MESERIRQLISLGRKLGVDLDQLLGEKIEELRARWRLIQTPNDRVKHAGALKYVERVRKESVDESEIDGLKRKPRSSFGRLRTDLVLQLERKQNYRCALCGDLLRGSRNVHVDHIEPVAQGGRSELENYQLLCRKCNQGKGDAWSWPTTNPFFPLKQSHLTARMRFAALAYHKSCGWDGCSKVARTGPLQVHLRVPYELGGRYILDNLWVLCPDHAVMHTRSGMATGGVRPLSLHSSRAKTDNTSSLGLQS